ncbi:hypothetical protein G6F62_002876 [Rhizopus arrhizus]|nr:hypothetical protein G6F24_002481 [Rhizopus arrhizus]KAG0794097.1 hypothetical protein G6F21_003123 [Rhizopus arrhizus]KAG0802124.1 hypothetical protein G6F22_000566 [Rhizopus arrhizus]KAG0815148.1 hypothetical protein G6F20_004215 [Rhizopus arrhizus]KAG0835205.1 hypothetical protein G6F19_004828 [Rhizopus arrhizus]
MSALLEDVDSFLSLNIKSVQDLNLDRLQKLLDSQKSEQKALDAQLNSLTHDSKHTLHNVLEQSTTQQRDLQALLGQLNETKHNLDHYETSTELLNNLTGIEEKLRQVDNARNYLKVLLVVCKLSSNALELVKTDPEKSIVPYEQLVKFEQYITHQQGVKENHSGLVEYLKKRQTYLWQELYAVLVQKFKDSLEAISWPTPIKPPYEPELRQKLKEFEDNFRHLIVLQQSSTDQQSVINLSPISIMLEGLSLRFKYHFETSKPTNRLDKPEWYLMHVKNSIAAHLPFLLTTVQPIIHHMKDYFDAKVSVKDLFIQGLLQDVSRKLQKTMPQILSQPNLLSHTIRQVLEFDKSLVDEFAYEKISQTRYDEIMLDRQAFDIEAGDGLKKTTSSARVISLLESVTSTYSLMPRLDHKLRFFIEIQLGLLSQYHQRLSSAIDSFEALSLIRSVPAPGALPDAVTGVMTASESNGTISALHRLYRWWTSAKSVIEALKDWEEDEFFLDMHFEFKQNPEEVNELLKELAFTQDKNKMVHLAHLAETESLFTDALAAFEQISQRTEKIFVKIAVKEWTNNARAYSKKNNWWESAEESEEVSDELYTPLQNFRMTFNYLHTILPEPDFLMVYRNALKEIEDWYWKYIITQNQFSAAGVSQLQTDLKLGLWKIGQKWVQKPENLTKRLKEAIILLSLPLSNENESCQALMNALVKDQLEAIQSILNKINIQILSNGQIRDVLRRRNDMLYSWN